MVLSFDEKGKISLKQYEGSLWCDDKDQTGKNVVYKVPAKQQVKGLLDYFAAKDIHADKVYYAFYDWKNAFIVIDFFERLLKAIPDKTIYVILDCWSAHRSARLQSFAALHSRLKLVFLPTNASWMNIIEQFFSQIERFVLRNSAFHTIATLITALSSFVTFGTRI